MSQAAHELWPERFAQITTTSELLKRPSYEVDIRNPDSLAKAKRVLRQLEDILVVKRDDKGQITRDEIIGFGLAASQIKELAEKGPTPRVGIIRIPAMAADQKPLELDMINPVIIDMDRPFKYKNEGCLSFPGAYLSTRRFRIVKVGFSDGITLEPREMSFYGIEAVIMQHEIDHHEGILYQERHLEPIQHSEPKIKPNDPCPCGSGKKHKKCCEGK